MKIDRKRLIRTACRLVAGKEFERGVPGDVCARGESEWLPEEVAPLVDAEIAKGTRPIHIPSAVVRAYLNQ